MHYYRLYGLLTESEIELPESEPINHSANIDVKIKVGPVSIDGGSHPKAVHPTENWWYCFVNEQHMLFQSYQAIFEVENGSQIVIEPFENANESELRSFLLGTAFGVLEIQRGTVPLHGGAILMKNGTACLIVGERGSGKSTLLSAMVADGYQYLTDDVAVLDYQCGAPFVAASYPQRKLSGETCAALRTPLCGMETLYEDGQIKYAVRDRSLWHAQPAQLGYVVELVESESVDAPLEMRQITGKECLSVLLRNLYRYMFYKTSIGFKPPLIKQLLTAASEAKIFQIIRPKSCDTLNAVKKLLQSI